MFNSSMCRVLVIGKETEEELRKAVSENPDNGSYATTICKNCGAFQFSESGDALTARIINSCEACPRDEKYQLLTGPKKFEKLREIHLTGR